MRKFVYLLMLVIGAYLILLLATLPARTVFSWFTNNDIRAAGVEGSIWRGSAATLTIGHTDFSPVTWRFTPSSLLVLKLGFMVEALQPDGFVWTRVEVSPLGAIALRDLQAALPVEPFSRTLRIGGLGGELDAHMTEVVLRTGWPRRLDGKVQIKRLRLNIPQTEQLGNYVLTFSDQRDDPLVGEIRDMDGPLALEGTLTLTRDRSYLIEGLITPRPSASTQLGNALQFIGPPKPAAATASLWRGDSRRVLAGLKLHGQQTGAGNNQQHESEQRSLQPGQSAEGDRYHHDEHRHYETGSKREHFTKRWAELLPRESSVNTVRHLGISCACHCGTTAPW